MDLRANTAVDVLIGPFVDSTDGNTTEDGLTLSQADIKLSKNGQALTQKNDATAAAFDDDGYYNCELDATDTNTEGNLVLIVHESGALPVRHEYNVLSEAAWDSMYTAKDDGFMDVNIKTIGRADTQETEANNLESACSNYSATRGLTGTALPAAAADAAGGVPVSDAGGLDLDTLLSRITANVATEAKQDTIDTVVDAIKAVTDNLPNSGALSDLATILTDTNELQTDLTNGGRLDLLIDAIKAVTDNLPNSGALTDLATAAALTTVDTVVDAIKAVTDNLPNSGALTDLATAAKLKAYVQLLARSDAAIETDNATELGEINNNEGSGAGDYSSQTEGQEAIRDHIGDGTNLTEAGGDGDHLTEAGGDGDHLTEAGGTGDQLTAVPYNSAWDAEIQSEVQDAIEANHLDHLLAATYDPASKPGAADALLNELVEDDSGVSRFTANSLEEAPTGGSAPTAAEIVNEWETQSQADPTGFHVNVKEVNGTAQTANDNSADINAILTDTNEIQGKLPTNKIMGSSDVDNHDTDIDSIVADTNELQVDWANGGRLDLILDSILAMLDDARTEPGQGAPPVNPDLATKIDYLYKAWRNKKEQTSTTFSLYDDAGTTVDQKSTDSDNGTTATKGEIGSGP